MPPRLPVATFELQTTSKAFFIPLTYPLPRPSWPPHPRLSHCHTPSVPTTHTHTATHSHASHAHSHMYGCSSVPRTHSLSCARARSPTPMHSHFLPPSRTAILSHSSFSPSHKPPLTPFRRVQSTLTLTLPAPSSSQQYTGEKMPPLLSWLCGTGYLFFPTSSHMRKLWYREVASHSQRVGRYIY